MIYHIVTEADFRACFDGGRYLPADFAATGFVHCALEVSVLQVANDYYAAVSEPLLLLRIDPAGLTSETRYEAASPDVVAGAAGAAGTSHLATSPVFPHVYGPINEAAIEGVGVLKKGGGGYEWPATFVALAEYRARGEGSNSATRSEASMGSNQAPAASSPRLSAADVWRAIGKHSFAVVSHVTASGEPRSSGVVYGTDKGHVLVAVNASSWKARTIADGQVVAVTIPVRRGGILSLLFPIPPAAISFHARARVGKPGALDRASLPKNFARLLPPSLAQTCIIELTPEGNFLTYGIGVSLMAMRDPKAAQARVPVA